MALSYELVPIIQDIYVNNSDKKLPEYIEICDEKYKVKDNINIYEKDNLQYCFIDNKINMPIKSYIFKKLKELGYDIISIQNSTTTYLKFKYDNFDFVPMLVEIAKKHKRCYIPSYENKTDIRLYKIDEWHNEEVICYNFDNKDKFVYIDYRYKNLIDELIETYNKPKQEEVETIITKEMRLFKLEGLPVYYFGDDNYDNIITAKRRLYIGRNFVWNKNYEFYSDMNDKELKKELIEWVSPEFILKCHKGATRQVKFRAINKKYYEYSKIKYHCFDEDKDNYYILNKYYDEVKKLENKENKENKENVNTNWETV